MSADVEERSVSREDLRGGLQLKAGHAVVLIVDGGGEARHPAAAAGDEEAAGPGPAAQPESEAVEATYPAAKRSGSLASDATPPAAKRSGSWATGATSMKPPAEPLPPAPPAEDPASKLHECKFEDGTELDGDTAWLATKVSGLDGQHVQFVLESEDGDGWRSVASGVSTINAGQARTGIALPPTDEPAQE